MPALTLTEVERRLEGRVPLLTQLFPQFASRLIRNGATIGGNLGTGSPIGDMAPALLALDATVLLVSAEGEREVPVAEYFVAYRQTVRRPDELIRAVRIPLPLAPVTAFIKIAKRRFDDISSVAVGVALDVEGRRRAGFPDRVGWRRGHPGPRPRDRGGAHGPAVDAGVRREAAGVLAGEGTPLSDHRASAAYRTAMLGTALLKVYAENPPAERRGEVTA